MRNIASETLPNRGYHMTYRMGGNNPCPGCGRSHWHIGRISAECAFCGAALPLAGGTGHYAWLTTARAA
jgi:hypothetical protein